MHISVITILLLIYHHDYISHLLNMGDYSEVAGGLLGIVIGSLIMAIIIIVLARLVEWGIKRM